MHKGTYVQSYTEEMKENLFEKLKLVVKTAGCATNRASERNKFSKFFSIKLQLHFLTPQLIRRRRQTYTTHKRKDRGAATFLCYTLHIFKWKNRSDERRILCSPAYYYCCSEIHFIRHSISISAPYAPCRLNIQFYFVVTARAVEFL